MSGQPRRFQITNLRASFSWKILWVKGRNHENYDLKARNSFKKWNYKKCHEATTAWLSIACPRFLVYNDFSQSATPATYKLTEIGLAWTWELSWLGILLLGFSYLTPLIDKELTETRRKQHYSNFFPGAWSKKIWSHTLIFSQSDSLHTGKLTETAQWRPHHIKFPWLFPTHFSQFRPLIYSKLTEIGF